MSENDPRLLLLNEGDNVLVLLATIDAGETAIVGGQAVVIEARIGLGHKLARRAIQAGEKVIKYGVSIGSATRDISVGEHVHVDNLKSDYTPTYSLDETSAATTSSKEMQS